MMSYEEARAIALAMIPPDCALIEESIMEKPYGWYFNSQSRKYLESGDVSDMLLGSAGFLVERKSGRVIGFGSGKPVEQWLADYEQGYTNDWYDLTVLSVRRLERTVDLLIRLEVMEEITEVEHGIGWKMRKPYTREKLRALLAELPCRFVQQHGYYRVKVFREMEQSRCCEFEVEEYASPYDTLRS